MDYTKMERSSQIRSRIGSAVIYFFLSVWAILVLFPFYWMVLTSFPPRAPQ